MSEKNVYRVRLLRWGDSSSSGRTVTFKLPDDEEDHPFKGLPVGAKNGQLLEMEIAIYEGDGEVETLGRIRKPRARIKPYLPVINDETVSSPAPDTGRRRAALENVTRRVIKSATEAPAVTTPATAPSASQPTTAPSAAPRVGPAAMPQHAAPAPMASDATYTASPASAPSQEAPPVPQRADTTAAVSGTGSGNGLDGAELDAYANQMGQAAEALAAVAERLDDHIEDDTPQFPTPPTDMDESLDPGVKAVRRATDLCQAIDKQRAGFYYFMRSRYPEAPKLPGEGGNWSRDAKTTRDRVCLHCEATKLGDLAENHDARKKFEELETEFERHERLR